MYYFRYHLIIKSYFHFSILGIRTELLILTDQTFLHRDQKKKLKSRIELIESFVFRIDATICLFVQNDEGHLI